jgi:hypothetical protein
MPAREPAPAAADRLVATRTALHAVAEQVLAGARFRATGRIGLRAAPGGFGTPPFPGPGGVRQILVDGPELVVRTDGGDRRAPITTVAAAAALVGTAPGAPEGVYPPATTAVGPDRPLVVDPAAAAVLAGVFDRTARALALLRRGWPTAPPDPAQLWPEHFDLAMTVAEVNLGGSPGDEGHAGPYLYVGPWDREGLTGPFWNESFGRSRPAAERPTVAAVLAFFREGLAGAAAR